MANKHNMITDVNGNIITNNVLEGYTTTATAAGTTTLDVASTKQQFFTGTTTQTVVLPVTSTLVLGQSFYIVNNSTGVVTVQSSGGNTIQAMAASTTLLVTCILTSGTGTASWNAQYMGASSGGTVNSGTVGQVAYYSASGNAVSGITADLILQRVRTQTGTKASGTTQIPWDNTIPQNTEGDQYMTLSITPKSATSILTIEIVAQVAHSVATAVMIGALFQDSTANALAAMPQFAAAADAPFLINYSFSMTSGTTSSTTFNFRAGGNTPGTLTFNGVNNTAYLGGVMSSSMIITEYAS